MVGINEGVSSSDSEEYLIYSTEQLWRLCNGIIHNKVAFKMPTGGGLVLDVNKRSYPLVASEYKLFEEIGQGVSATVYRAHCVTYNEIVAIKSLDLEKCNSNLVSSVCIFPSE